MQDNSQLNRGELPLDKVVELIKADTPSNATVDLSWMANNIDYIQEFKNFRIPLARNATSEEIAERQTMARQHPGYRVSPITITNAETYIQVKDLYTKEVLKQTIREAYRNHTNQELETEEVKNRTTVFDPEHNSSASVQVNKNPNTQKGEDLGSGEVTSGVVK